MNAIKEILPLTFYKCGIKKQYIAESVLFHWQEVVGPEIAVNAQAVKVQNGLLFVIVNNSVWCHHLSMMKNSLLEKIWNFTGEKTIQDIRFQAGCFSQQSSNDEENREITIFEKTKNIKLDSGEIKKIDNMVCKIDNKDLKKKLHSLLKKQAILNQTKKQHQWHTCNSCDSLCPPEQRYCTLCELQQKEKKIEEIQSILKHLPWLTYSAVQQYVRCSPIEFQQARNNLIDVISQDLYNGNAENYKVAKFIMLTTHRQMDEIDALLIEQTRTKFGRKEYVSTSRGR